MAIRSQGLDPGKGGRKVGVGDGGGRVATSVTTREMSVIADDA